MKDTMKAALLAKVTATLKEARGTLTDALEQLDDGEELAALGALSGLGQRVQYVETLLTVLRDLQPR